MAGLGGGGGGSGAVRAGRAFVELGARDGALLRSLDKVQARFMNLSKMMTRVGSMTAIGGGMALAPVVAKYAEFDDAIRAVAARTEATGVEFDSLRAKALELGRTTSFTAVEVANLMNALGTGGFNPTEIVEMTAAVLDMARASGTTADTAGKILSEAINAFGLTAADATAMADKFTAAANKSAVSVESLGETFGYLAPLAKDLGITVDQSLALAGALGNVGIQGSEAGTALRRIGVLISSGDADLTRIFGVRGKDAGGNVRPVIDVLDDIQKSMIGLGNAAKTEKLNEFFGLLGITSASALGKSVHTVKELEAAIVDSGGTAAKTSALMDAGLGGSFRRLRGSAESLAIEMGAVLAPVLGEVAAFVQLVGTAVRNWIANNGELAGTIGRVIVLVIAAGVAMAALGLAITTTMSVVGAFAAGIGAVVGVVTALLNPLTLAAAAVAVLGGKLLANSDAGKGFLAGLAEGMTELVGTFSTAWEGIVASVKKGDLEGAFAVAGAALRLEWQKVVLFWTKLWVEFRTSFLKGLIELGARIDSTFVGRFSRELVSTTRKAAGLAVDVAEGVMRIPIGLAGLAGLRDGPGGAAVGVWGPAFAAARERMGPPGKPVSMIGAALTPAFGFGIGQVIGPAVAAAVNAELEKDPAVRAAEADLRRARAEFDAAMAEAMKPPPVPVEVAPMPRDPNEAPMPREVVPEVGPPPRPILDAASVKGAFAVSNARQQFGYGDTIEKKQLDALKDIKDGKGALAGKIGDAVLRGIVAK